MSDEDAADYEEMTDDLEGLIKDMQAHMGRFPTQSEVVSFVWGTDAEKEKILNNGS